MANRDKKPPQRSMEKVLFYLEPGAWHGSAAETMWATPVAADHYILENVPFYAYGVSYGDTVLTTRKEGMPVFAKVLHHSGHSTYRLLVSEAHRQEFEKFWAPLQERGCVYEEGFKPLLAVDVPSEANILRYTDCWRRERRQACGHLKKAIAGIPQKEALQIDANREGPRKRREDLKSRINVLFERGG